MFRAMLYTQWKWARLTVLGLAVIAAALPVWSVRAVGGVIEPAEVGAALNTFRMWSAFYVLLAAGAGLGLALSAWAADQRGHHTYALSLPLPRWHYVLLKYGAGLALLVVPAVALAIGAAFAAGAVVLPPGLHTYPGGLVLRWLLAAFVAYSVFFAISAGTTRTAGVVLGVFAGLILADVLLALMEQPAGVMEFVFYRMFRMHGVFEVFTGRWMLIDV